MRDPLARLAAQAQSTGPAALVAREHLCIALGPTINSLAWQGAVNTGNPERYVDDFRQAASLGVLLAVEDFDPTRGAQFKTWAYFHIRKSVQRAYDTFNASDKTLSLDDVRSDDGETLAEEHPALARPDAAYERMEQTELHLRLAAGLKKLTERQLDIVHLTYWAGETQQNIAAALGTNQPTISRELAATFKQLREYLRGYAS